MIVSYETFRMHVDKFQSESTCDLLICDEAHRLKNDQTLTNKVSIVERDPKSLCRAFVDISGSSANNEAAKA